METDSRAEQGALPPDFGDWSKPGRWLLRTLLSLPSWCSHAFAYVSDAQLAEWRQCDERTVRRMRREALERGELERRYVPRGAVLPDGTKARRGMRILVEGPMRRARHGAATVELLSAASGDTVATEEAPASAPPSPAPSLHDQRVLADAEEARAAVRELARALGQTDRLSRSNDPATQDNLSADRSIDQLQSNKLNQDAEPAGELAELAEPASPDEDTDVSDSPVASADPRSTLLESEGSNDDPASDWRASSAIATHYALATGQKWRRIRPDILTFVHSFVAEMIGSESNKVSRAIAVIDRVVARAKELGAQPPTLRFIFHPQIYWKRLAGLTKAPRRGAQAPIGSPSRARPGLAAPRASRPSTVTLAQPDEDLLVMAAADAEARARRGLPPRYVFENAS